MKEKTVKIEEKIHGLLLKAANDRGMKIGSLATSLVAEGLSPAKKAAKTKGKP